MVSNIQWGEKVFSQPPIVQVLPLKKMRETGLHSREGTVGFKIVSDLFVNLAFEDFGKAGQYGYRSVTVWV